MKPPEIPGYRIEDVAGRGGTGFVYRAVQLSLGRRVALKVIDPGRVQDPAVVARLSNWASCASKIVHPSVVAVYDFLHRGELCYLAMEYVEGGTLRQMLDSRGKIPEPEALQIAAGIAEALMAVARAGLNHRNVSPANVLLASDSAVKLTDFGHAARLGAVDTSRIVGTPSYISPEAVRCVGDMDVRSDLYSLGAVLFHMLAGRPPFEGRTAREVARRHLEDDPPPIRSIEPSVSVLTDWIVSRLLEKDRERRYPHPDDLLADVREALRALSKAPAAPVSVARPGVLPPPSRPDAPQPPAERTLTPGKLRIRSGATIGLAGAAVALLLGGFGIYWLRDVLFPAPPPPPSSHTAGGDALRPPAGSLEPELATLRALIERDPEFRRMGEVDAAWGIARAALAGDALRSAEELYADYRARLEDRAWQVARSVLARSDEALDRGDGRAALDALAEFPDRWLRGTEAGRRIAERMQEIRGGARARVAALLDQAARLEQEGRYAEALGLLEQAGRLAPDDLEGAIAAARERVRSALGGESSTVVVALMTEYLVLDGSFRDALAARNPEAAAGVVRTFLEKPRSAAERAALTPPVEIPREWRPAEIIRACREGLQMRSNDVVEAVLTDLRAAAEIALALRAIAASGDMEALADAELLQRYLDAGEPEPARSLRAGLLCFYARDPMLAQRASAHLRAAVEGGEPFARRFLRTAEEIEQRRLARDLAAWIERLRQAAAAGNWEEVHALWARIEPHLEHEVVRPHRQELERIRAGMHRREELLRDWTERLHAAVEFVENGRVRFSYDFVDAAQVEAFEPVDSFGGTKGAPMFRPSRSAGVESGPNGAAMAWKGSIRGDVVVEMEATFASMRNVAIVLFASADGTRGYACTLGLDVVSGNDDPRDELERIKGLPRHAIVKYPVGAAGAEGAEFWRRWSSAIVGGVVRSFRPEPLSTHRVRVEREGAALRMRVDGAVVCAGEDMEYTEGRLLIVSGSRIQIRELRITMPLPE